jgi:hypothetical protein
MHYIINPIWFYLFNLTDNLRMILFLFLLFGGAYSFITLISGALDGSFDHPLYRVGKKLVIPLIISIFLITFIPSKDTLTKMLVASYVTQENINTATETSKDIVDYITEKIIEMKNAEGAK